MDSSKLETNPSTRSHRCFLYYLPQEILRLLANYFLKEEDQNKMTFRFCRDWRNFLNTNRQHFAKLKKESQLIVLRLPLASKFYSSSEVRDKVFQYIENPREQIEIFLSYHHYEHYSKSINLESINNLKRISVSSCRVSSTP
jgi:pyruvate-formate lyase-activating enzyme